MLGTQQKMEGSVADANIVLLVSCLWLAALVQMHLAQKRGMHSAFCKLRLWNAWLSI